MRAEPSDCPKAMVHGPCGGVTPAGSCEVDESPCPFVRRASTAAAPDARPGHVPNAAAQALLDLAAKRPLVIAGLPSEAVSADEIRAVTAALAGHVDAALLGDAPWARVQLPPSLKTQLVNEEGVPAWASLNCRDRNRVALEGELLGLQSSGVAAVHCVTGDHTALGDRPDARPVFDLDAPRLAGLASGRGMIVSVAEAPAAPPQDERPARAALKAYAGAEVCFVNHAPYGPTADFIAQTAELAPQLRCIVCVPLAASEAGLERLHAFARVGVPAATSAALTASDPVGAAVKACVAEAEALLKLRGVAGVNVSAAAGPGEELQIAGALALVADALGGGA